MLTICPIYLLNIRFVFLKVFKPRVINTNFTFCEFRFIEYTKIICSC